MAANGFVFGLEWPSNITIPFNSVDLYGTEKLAPATWEFLSWFDWPAGTNNSVTLTLPYRYVPFYSTNSLASHIHDASCLCETNIVESQIEVGTYYTNIVWSCANTNQSYASGFFRFGSWVDTDNDLMTDAYELLVAHTDPYNYDTDNDGLGDGDEVLMESVPLSWDTDGDGLNDFYESMSFTNPRVSDTDGDGVSDYAEVMQGSNPCDASDGGSAPAPERIIELPFSIYGDYASWEMTIQGLGPEDYRVLRLSMAAPGDSKCVTNKLWKGNSYRLSMEWLRSKRAGDINWYCWCAQVGGLPKQRTYNDYSYERIPGAAEIIAGNGWIIDNTEGLLTAHVDENETEGGNVAEGKYATLYVLDGKLVPDYDRDSGIDAGDVANAVAGKMFRFWINDDEDVTDNGGKYSTSADDDIPGARTGFWEFDGRDPNWSTENVDGFRDLIDFAPVWIDLSYELSALPDSIELTYKIKQGDEAVNVVWTSLANVNASKFQTESTPGCGASLDESVESARTHDVTQDGISIPAGVLALMENDPSKGVFLIEGAKATTNPLVLEAYYDGNKVLKFELPLGISGVEDMYRWVNLRACADDGDVDKETAGDVPSNLPDSETKNVNVFFLHGYSVNEAEARGWSAETFKRLWQAGSNARFWAVTWHGDSGWPNAFYYHDNVNNAFLTAPMLATYVNSNGVGGKIVMAHSLGNMVVSSAIQDHSMSVDNYFMLNAAVPSEAFVPAFFNDSPTNVLVHTAWQDYTNRTWSCKWHELFPGTDDRSKLTWKGRFADVASIAHNFYSSGDEVFELYKGTPGALAGGSSSKGRYAWHKQEVYKGRAANNALAWAATSWSGWGFREKMVIDPVTMQPVMVNMYSPKEASAIPIPGLTTNTVFGLYPVSMATNVISRAVLDEHLAKGIPALSAPVGLRSIIGTEAPNDVSTDLNAISIPNGWWRTDGGVHERWLHSDIKNAAFFYNYKAFEKFVEKGDMK